MRAIALALTALLAACSSTEQPRFASAERRDLVLSAEVSGELAAADFVAVTPPAVTDVWNFKVTFLADEGSRVSAGQPVVGFDSSELMRSLEVKQNELAAAEADLAALEHEAAIARENERLAVAEAQAQLRKAQLLVDKPEEMTAARELAKARIDVEMAKELVAYLAVLHVAVAEQRRANINLLRDERDRAAQRIQELSDAIGRMKIAAPRDGTIIFESDHRGERVKVGDSVWRARRILAVASLEQLEGRGTVDEVDMAKLALDQAVVLRLEALPDEEFRGRLSRIAEGVGPKSHENPTRVVRVRFSLDETDPERMRPGMRFRGTIETGRIERALVVPEEALVFSAEGISVLRRRGDDLEEVAVEIGARADGWVELKGGIEEGDEIALMEGNAP